MTTLQDPRLIAQIAMGQLSDVVGGENRSVTHLFLREPFALGYAIGFVEQAWRYAKKEIGDENCPTYLLEAISKMLGNEAVAASFMSFAVSKRGDRMFEGGYDVGLSDMDAWCLSQSEYKPSSLSRYLGSESSILQGV